MNKVIIQKLDKAIKSDKEFSIKRTGDKYIVEMPSIKIDKRATDFISQYGVERFLDVKYSLYQEKVWKHFVSKVRKSLPKSIKIDKWELHDDYVYPNVIISYPTLIQR